MLFTSSCLATCFKLYVTIQLVKHNTLIGVFHCPFRNRPLIKFKYVSVIFAVILGIIIFIAGKSIQIKNI